MSTTPDNQILVELAPEDTGPANLFDLNGRTLVFTPEGHGRYSRSVQPVAWEDEIGRAVADGEEIHLQSFMFDFAGHRWGSFFVSRRGVITFGEPLAYQYWDDGNRFGTMLQAAGSFVTTPTISPLFKPLLDEHGGGTLAVERFTDRVVVTWIAKDFAYDVFDPKLSRFQVVLDADGSIRFSYADVNFGDGIVGLFDDRGVERGRLLTNVADPTDSDLPGHLDLLDAAIYATNAESMVVLEFTLREPIPDPGAGEVFSYRLYFDTDEPYWTHPDWSDEDAVWLIHVSEGGEYAARGEGVVRFLGGRGKAKLSLLADASVLGGDGRRVAAMAFTNAAHFRNDEHVEADFSSTTLLEFSTPRGRRVDLSASESQFVRDHAEIFHYRSAPDTQEIACRVIEALGDDFDLLVFHAEFRLDSQEARTAWYAYDTGVEGVGRRFGSAPCGYGRLKGHWVDPVWMRSFLFGEAHVPESHRFDGGADAVRARIRPFVDGMGFVRPERPTRAPARPLLPLALGTTCAGGVSLA